MTLWEFSIDKVQNSIVIYQPLSESVLVFPFSGLLNFVLASDQTIVKNFKAREI
jgi:hypothetical protein